MKNTLDIITCGNCKGVAHFQNSEGDNKHYWCPYCSWWTTVKPLGKTETSTGAEDV